MVNATLNIFDLIVILVIGLSALLSFFRGFARELLSLGAWVGASMVTLYAFPRVARWLEPQVKNAAVASGLASMGVFLVSLVLISILTSIFLKFVKKGEDVGAMDNVVGLFFGIARGILLVAIGYFVLTLVLNEKDYPVWLKESATRPYVARAAHWVSKLTPSYLEALTDDEKKAHKTKHPMDDVKKSVAHHEDADDATDSDTKPDSDKEAPAVHDKAPADDDSKGMPTFDELQKRIRDENQRNQDPGIRG